MTNYSSVQAILDAGVTNATKIVDNTRHDDDTISVTGVDWFTYKSTVASTVYVNGNSDFGFGNSSATDLLVDNRDDALWNMWREEGTLYNTYNFLRIRWDGYSHYSAKTEAYHLCYDVILFSTGDIFLYLISMPTNNYTGKFTLNSVSYTPPTLENPYITFYKTSEGFTIDYTLITLENPGKRKFLLKSGTSYYTYTDTAVSLLTETTLNSDLFKTYGVDNVPVYAVLQLLTDPTVLYWQENAKMNISTVNAFMSATPFAQPIITYAIDISSETITGIEGVTGIYEGNPVFAVSLDGITWKSYSNGWVTLSNATSGMTFTEMSAIILSQWAEFTGAATSFYLRCTLLTTSDKISNITFDFSN